VHHVAGEKGGQTVPWLPYFGGTIHKSDYFIVGGITELNYNINSGGGEIGVNQVGFKRRAFSQSVGIDLRIVNTKTLMILKTVSLTKQFNGYEVGFNIFRFFGSDLFDIDIGAKGQEPLQLGIRATLEEGVVRLLGAVTKVDPKPCLGMRAAGALPIVPAEQLHVESQLRSLGYEVRAVADPREALQAIREACFDLLFTDIVMPGGMNGRELANEAIRIRPGVAVLFTTGYAQSALVSEVAMPAGVHLLQKPYRRQELAAAVRMAFEQAQRKGAT
jgi:CheY-like chemotaxis protein